MVEGIVERELFERSQKARAQSDRKVRRYRCRAQELGHECSQTSIKADEAEAQVVSTLKQLQVPKDWRDRMVQAIGELIGDRKLEERLVEIYGAIERMDFRWDHGFITDKDAYHTPAMVRPHFEQRPPCTAFNNTSKPRRRMSRASHEGQWVLS